MKYTSILLFLLVGCQGMGETALETNELVCTSAACTPSGKADGSDGSLPAPQILEAVRTDVGTTVVLGWRGSTMTGVTEYVVSRQDLATSEPDRWTVVTRVPAEARTFRDETLSAPSRYRILALAGEEMLETSPSLVARPIAGETYDMTRQVVDGLPFATDLYGVVRYPADLSGGPFPLVLLLHGNHGNCRVPGTTNDYCVESESQACGDAMGTASPNAEGLAYLADALAAQGMIAVSVSANALNCRDGFIVERSKLLLAHLELWATMNEVGALPFDQRFVGAVDLQHVGLVGHSRGAEAVALVPGLAAGNSRFSIASVFSIAPTDFEAGILDRASFAVLLPACDGDVTGLSGRSIYDRSRARGAASERHQVLYVGANHNFFNTEWTQNDGTNVCDPASIASAAESQGMLGSVLSAWAGATLLGAALPPYFRADEIESEISNVWAGRPLDLRWSYSAAARATIDDFTAATADAQRMNSFAGFTDAAIDTTGLLPRLGLRWRAAATASFAASADASEYEAISFRITSYEIEATKSQQDAAIRVVDSAGNDATLRLADLARVFNGYPAFTSLPIPQTVRVPIAGLRARNTNLDLTRLATVSLELDANSPATGAFTLSELELAR